MLINSSSLTKNSEKGMTYQQISFQLLSREKIICLFSYYTLVKDELHCILQIFVLLITVTS